MFPHKRKCADTLWMFQNDFDDFPPTFSKLVGDSTDDRLAPATWIAGVAGGFLISLALIMAFSGLRRNRATPVALCVQLAHVQPGFEWYSFMSRMVAGIAVCLLSIIDTSDNALSNWVANGWMCVSPWQAPGCIRFL